MSILSIPITNVALADYRDKIQQVLDIIESPLLSSAQRLAEIEKIKVTIKKIKDSLIAAKETTNDASISIQIDAILSWTDLSFREALDSFVSGSNVVELIDSDESAPMIIVDGGTNVPDINEDHMTLTPEGLIDSKTNPVETSSFDLGFTMTEIPNKSYVVATPVAPETTEVTDAALSIDEVEDTEPWIVAATTEDTALKNTEPTKFYVFTLEGVFSTDDEKMVLSIALNSKTPLKDIIVVSGQKRELNLQFK